MKHLTIIAIAIAALMASCTQNPGCGSNKDAFLQGYYQLIDEAKAASLPVSDSGWKRYDERFRAYVEECYDSYEAELSAKERRRFWATSMKYYAQRYGKGAIQELKEKKGGGAGKVKEEVEAIWGDIKKGLKEATGEGEKEPTLRIAPDNTPIE